MPRKLIISNQLTIMTINPIFMLNSHKDLKYYLSTLDKNCISIMLIASNLAYKIKIYIDLSTSNVRCSSLTRSGMTTQGYLFEIIFMGCSWHAFCGDEELMPQPLSLVCHLDSSNFSPQ